MTTQFQKNTSHNLDAIARHVRSIVRDKGWWGSPHNDGELIALLHSEMSEARGCENPTPDARSVSFRTRGVVETFSSDLAEEVFSPFIDRDIEKY